MNAGDVRVGDTLERRVAPFTVARIHRTVGGWNGKQNLVVLESSAGERMSLLEDHRMSVPVHLAHVPVDEHLRAGIRCATCARCGDELVFASIGTSSRDEGYEPGAWRSTDSQARCAGAAS